MGIVSFQDTHLCAASYIPKFAYLQFHLTSQISRAVSLCLKQTD